MTINSKELEIKNFINTQVHGDPFERLGIRPERLGSNERENQKIINKALKDTEKKEMLWAVRVFEKGEANDAGRNKCAEYLKDPESRAIIVRIREEKIREENQQRIIKESMVAVNEMIIKIVNYYKQKYYLELTENKSSFKINDLKVSYDAIKKIRNNLLLSKAITTEDFERYKSIGLLEAKNQLKKEKIHAKNEALHEQNVKRELNKPLTGEDIQYWQTYTHEQGIRKRQDPYGVHVRFNKRVNDIVARAHHQDLVSILQEVKEKKDIPQMIQLLALDNIIKKQKKMKPEDYSSVISYICENRKDKMSGQANAFFVKHVETILGNNDLDFVSIAKNSTPSKALVLLQTRFVQKLDNQAILGIVEAHKGNAIFTKRLKNEGFGNGKTLDQIQGQDKNGHKFRGN